MSYNPSILDLNKWRPIFLQEGDKYQAADPYPYIQFEQFLEVDAAKQAMESFPRVEGPGWINYIHVNENKHGLNKMDRIPAYLQEVIRNPKFGGVCANLKQFNWN